MNYEDLTGPSGQADNTGGLTQRLWYAPIADFLSIKKPTASPTTAADLVTIATAHTFKTGKCFNVMYITQDKGKYDADAQGDTDGKSFKQKVSSFYPGNEASAHGIAAMVKNDQFIVIVENPDGTMNQIGTELMPSNCTPKYIGGSNAQGTRGYEFEWMANTTRNWVYTAAVSVTPAP